MSLDYQNLARKFRPKSFAEVLGQDEIVTTLQNALKHSKVSHAYLFSGSRGSGKTTLARIFAKALNCKNPKENSEPCNECQSCKEITGGSSLDVIEIDGASNRGIDDIREINETVHYAPSYGNFKIYIIDEVHMLTKEAFNALLKTLEEPPEKVKFFFATTEPHKVLPTILSRCQRFDLKRISKSCIKEKLSSILQELSRECEPRALELIAESADGSLRDAESSLDQILCLDSGAITEEIVSRALGVTEKSLFSLLDEAVQKGDKSFAFTLSEKLYQAGRDFSHFLDELLVHFRDHLLSFYEAKNSLYTDHELIYILDLITEQKGSLHSSHAKRVHTEMILLHILRVKKRVSIESLITRLTELEKGGYKEPLFEEKALIEEKTVHEEPKEMPSVEEKTSLESSSTSTTEEEISHVELPFSLNTEEPKTEPTPAPMEEKKPTGKSKAEYDTLYRFAQVELEGSLKYLD